MHMQTLWFRRKRYGWGWYPVRWQGWLVILAFVAYAAAMPFLIGLDVHPDRVWWFVGLVVVGVVALITVCWKTGESPRWQWGKKEQG